MRHVRTETHTYGTVTYVIQTDLTAGSRERYTVYRLDSYSKQAYIVGRELPLREARRQCPGLVK